jgi:glycosyltransferase involved in cell wall biosynthesis
MRIGALVQTGVSAANYRIAYPFAAFELRGHQMVLPDQRGETPLRALLTCDVVMVYRRCDNVTRQIIGQLKRAGVAIVWDNDDDFLNMPKNRHARRRSGMSNHKIFSEMVKTARMADRVIVTTAPLAATLTEAGVDDVTVIENYLLNPHPRPLQPHQEFTIGWIAGREHVADAAGLRLAEVLDAIQAKHPGVTVTTVGTRLRLAGRHRHAERIDFYRLPEVMANFDIGIAPLLDTPFNRSRSNIKVKEYAASQVPWLASAVGPYLGLGELEGGRLVDEDGWFDALDDLICNPSTRQRLRTAGALWAQTQAIDEVAPAYEAVFAAAIGRASRRTVAGVGAKPAG